jgi:chitinase
MKEEFSMVGKSRVALCRFPLVSLAALLVCAAPLFADGEGRNGKILAGFFEEWSIYYADYNVANLQQNGVADKLSHLIYAFANVTTTPSAGCALADTWADYQDPYLPSVNGTPYTSWPYGNFGALIQLKQLHPNLKILVSIGGASASNTAAFSAAASTAAGRSALAASCINIFIQGNVGTDYSGNPVSTGTLFDGINIDWEFPTSTDTQNFTSLLEEFRKQLDALGKHYLLSFDGPAGEQNYSNIQLAEAAKQVDFITIDGYNYNGTWENVANHASPLFDSKQDPEYGQGLYIDFTVDAYLAAGVPPSKYVMGVPLYGAGWTDIPNVNHGLYQTSTASSTPTPEWPAPVLLANGTGLCPDTSGNTPGCDTLLTPGVATYSTLSTLTSNGYGPYFDPRRIAVWLYNPTTETFWSYDNPSTALLKTLYVWTRVPGGLAGNFVWALKDDDANGTMVKTLAKGLGR